MVDKIGRVGLCPSSNLLSPQGSSPFRSFFKFLQEAISRFFNTIWSKLSGSSGGDNYSLLDAEAYSMSGTDGGAGRLELLTTKGQKIYLSYSIALDYVRIERPGGLFSGHRMESRTVPFIDVLWAGITDDVFELSYLSYKKWSKNRELVILEGKVQSVKPGTADEWCSEIMTAAYKDVNPHRRIRCWINPHSGKGKAKSIYQNIVGPILEAARCDVVSTYTGHPKHAYEEAKDFSIESFDAVCVVSGDGVIHEVLNGFAEHQRAEEALNIPIVPIPAGSGNAAALNLMGFEHGSDPCLAALNAIKGKPMKQDVMYIIQGDKKTYSFLTVCAGLMAELDIDSEWMRFLGSSRFVLGFLIKLIKFRAHMFNLQLKVEEEDKNKMIESLLMARDGTLPPPNRSATKKPRKAALASLFPPVPTRGDGWIKIDRPMVYIYAGLQPYVASDLMQFPVSLPSDGMIDIVTQERTTRMEMLTAIDGASKGQQFYIKSQHYYKTKAFHLSAKSTSDILMIDGEYYPFEPMEVTVKQGFMTFMSMHGTFAYDQDFGN